MSHDTPAWNDLALFIAVARGRTLAAAARSCGTSTATLSRRMAALEAQMGRRLFLHGASGYALTQDGAALLERVGPMEGAARSIAQWQSDATGPQRVRLSAGAWNSIALAQNLTDWWSPDASWVPEFQQSNEDMDIARREIDIGIRNRRPDQPWLAGRRTRSVEYAAFGHPDAQGWIGVAPATTPSARWVQAHHKNALVTTANDPRLALELALRGVGRVVLPLFIGETTDLDRQGGVIDDLTHEEWLVCHHEARHTPPIRAALDALAAYLKAACPS